MSIRTAVLAILEKLKNVVLACPELTFVGDPILRTVCTEVTLKEGLEIAEQLKKVLLKHREVTGYGRGFAAPQIGYSKKIFITFVNDTFKAYLNPAITQYGEITNYYRELCMSSGCLSADVERPAWIVIRYTNERGEEVEERAEGFIARLLQHEYDHLQGVVNLDKAVAGSIEFVTKDPLKETLRDKPEK